jgi:hypothetical protein
MNGSIRTLNLKFCAQLCWLPLVITIFAGFLHNNALATTNEPSTAVLASNSEFYRAFRESDMLAMEKVWATSSDVVVIHPGWPRLTGLADVMASWRMILQNPNSPKIRAVNTRVEFRDGLAFVTCDELVGGGVIRAMNIFKHKNGRWQMLFHGAASTVSSQT